MIQRLIEPASTYAGDIDWLFTFMFIMVGFWFLVAEGAFFALIWKFRYKEGQPALYVTGHEKDLKRWVSIPHYLIIFCDIFIIFFAVQVWYNIKQNLPPAERTVQVIGQQWAWSFVHPGADGELGTDDDIATVDELHVEVDTVYHFKLSSMDTLHSFSVPVFRLKQDAIPGRVITGWFEPTLPGEYDIQCAEMCGVGHGIMGARIFVETAEEHEAWLAGTAGS
jgi:cytochrome c oxidase subunit 2